jgi:hypothetical protein
MQKRSGMKMNRLNRRLTLGLSSSFQFYVSLWKTVCDYFFLPAVSFHKNARSSETSLTRCFTDTPELCPACVS